VRFADRPFQPRAYLVSEALMALHMWREHAAPGQPTTE
jgi:hypothetical protein